MAIYLLSPLIKEHTEHLPMISFEIISDSLDLSRCDTLMFTSKQAVKSADILNPKWRDIPSLAIGSATAKMILSLGGQVIHQPSSFYGKSLSIDIIDKFKDKNILYIRPKVVSFDSKSFLSKAGIDIDEQMIYQTSCISYDISDKPPKESIIIFTSPSTIKCFMDNFGWDESYRSVVIGEATKAHLPPDAQISVAQKATIDSCIETALELSSFS